MTFADWVSMTREQFRERPPRAAAYTSTSEFVTGVAKRAGRFVNFGRRVWDRDWEVLVVLDACRADLWREVATEYDWADGDPETMFSCASSSQEWMRKHFGDEYREETARTALLTANVWTSERTDPDHWAHLDEVWRDGWDDGVGQTPPEVVRDAAVGFWRHHREAVGAERLIVWFMQPHIPFLGVDGSHGYEHDGDGPVPGMGGDYERTPWHRLRDGDLTREQVWEAYADNLRVALDSVAVLRENLDTDRMVVTADHGNAMGEWLMYGHEVDAVSPAMKRVPWVPVSASDERTHEATYALDERTDLSDDEVADRLEALGYA
jgi:hypothetical protein